MIFLKEFKNLWRNELFRSSLILIILLNIANFINYLYQFAMVRMLGPVDYGVLAVLTSIIYIFSVPTLSIQTIVSKHTTQLAVKKEFGKIKGFFEYMIKKTLVIAIIIFVLFVIFTPYLSNILNIPVLLLITTGLFLFGAFVYPAALGIFQGTKKFNAFGWNSIANPVIKVLSATILILIGFAVYGAVLGFILGVLGGVLLALPFIYKNREIKKEKEEIKIFSREILSTSLAMLIIVIIYSTDVIFARIFFAPEIVGKYAVISLIGKIILFGSSGIAFALFPISSEKFLRGDATKSVLKKASLATLLWCGFLVALFFIFPDLIIKILFGSTYLSFKGILLFISIAFSFISFLNLFILYKISTNRFKLKHVFILILFLAIQISTFYLFRNSVELFSIGFMVSTIISFIGSIILIRG